MGCVFGIIFGNYILNFFLFFLLHSTILSACESAENAGKCAEAKRRVDSAEPNP